MKITILGNGVFGKALESYLIRIGHSVFIDEIRDSEVIFLCVPSNVVVSALLKVQKEIINQKIIICSKGFAEEGKLISSALKEEFKNEIFFLYGPTLAEEISRGVFSGMVLAGAEGKEDLKKQIESENLYIENTDDCLGMEISASLKNVMAILIGIVEGAQFGKNTEAFIFTKAVQEIKNIGLSLGAKSETFLELSCIGDLYLPSRNRLLGVELGKGRKLNDIIKETNYTPAGVYALKDALVMLKKNSIDGPLITLLHRVIYEDFPIKDIFNEIKKINYK